MPTGSSSSAIGTSGGSMSTISPKMVSGCHVLKVEGYSSIMELPYGTRIESTTFTVGGHTWYISYYRSGYRGPIIAPVNTNRCVVIELNLHNPPASGEVFARVKFSLLDQAGEIVYSPNSGTGSNKLYTFSREAASHVDFGIIKKKELASLYIKDDSFKIRCDVTVSKDILHAEDEPVTVLPPDLHRHLGDLLESQVGGDVTFDVNGELITAHRYVLAARSSVFMAQFFGPMKEKTASHVRVNDMDARVFMVMLRFIYTDMLPTDIQEEEETVMAQHLLVAADIYSLDRLKSICEDILCKGINTDVVASTLVLAEQHGCCGLKNACFKCFKFLVSPGNLKRVMASDSFQGLMNCPSLLVELLAKVAP